MIEATERERKREKSKRLKLEERDKSFTFIKLFTFMKSTKRILKEIKMKFKIY